MSTFGGLLQEFTASYFADPRSSKIDITTWCTTKDKIEALYAACQEHGVNNFSKRDIITFLTNLFRNDPKAHSLMPKYNQGYVDYQESGAPYKYGLIDYNNIEDRDPAFEEKSVQLDVDNSMLDVDEHKPPVSIKYKRPIKRIRKQQQYKARPKCEADQGGCNKLAYFGLPFCPWCMRQIPPFYPKTNHKKFMFRGNAELYDDPIVDFEMIADSGCREEDVVTHMIAGVATRFNKNDCIVDDGDIKVTYGDVERAKKNIDKFIP